jgi:glycosyltransferase involved in cell wall biosynthesis
VKVLVAVTYYRPWVSGLTIYVERLSEALAARGHQVTVLTSRFDRSLPRREVLNGVHVERVPVAFAVSKGVIMPTYGWAANRLVRRHDVLSVHLPQFDAWGLAMRARIFRKPCVLTYHCDLELPPGLFNRVVDQVTFAANYVAAIGSHRIVAYTDDYAKHSRLLRRFPDKIEVIPPPVVMPEPGEGEAAEFRARHGLGEGPVLGMAARFAAEKGVDVVLDAMPALLERFPGLQLAFAGPYQGIAGEEAYRARLFPRIEALGEHWRFVGTLDPVREMPAFFGALDCLLVPSVNSTESFGLVQVEAMLCGTPVVASNLPGVRQPVRMTGMGEVAEVGDAASLASAVTRVLQEPASYRRNRSDIAEMFDLERTVQAYESLFERQQRRRRGAGP